MDLFLEFAITSIEAEEQESNAIYLMYVEKNGMVLKANRVIGVNQNIIKYLIDNCRKTKNIPQEKLLSYQQENEKELSISDIQEQSVFIQSFTK